MARKFSFTIPKPVENTSASTEADKFADALFDELVLRFPTPGAGSDDAYNNIISVLFPSSATEKEITFDRGFSKESEQRVLTAQFGDGYEQRIKDGINTKVEKFSMNINNRTWEEIELISAFLDVKTPKSFSITLQREPINVVCDSYSLTAAQSSIHSISAELRRVYEP